MRERGGERVKEREEERGRRGEKWEGEGVEERGWEKGESEEGGECVHYGTTYIEASKQTLGDFCPVCAAMESDNGI